MLDVYTFLVTVYCIVDDLYQARFAAQKPRRRGAKPEMADSEVLTLALLAQGEPHRSERAFLRYVREHWRSYFPRPLSQSAFNRRARDLMGVLCQLGPAISQATHQVLGSMPAYEVLDTVPVPLMRRCRGVRRRLFGVEAAIGCGGSDRGWYYGVSLLAAVNQQGHITGFVAGPANTEERWLADALLRWRQNPHAPAPHPEELAPVLSPSHHGPRQGPTGPLTQQGAVGVSSQVPYLPPPRWFHRLRQIVEPVSHVLTDQLGLKSPRPRTYWGLLTRLAAKISAFNMLVHLNYRNGLPTFSFHSPLA